MKVSKKLIALLMVTAVTGGTFVGCSSTQKEVEASNSEPAIAQKDNNDATADKVESELEHVELTWYYHGDPMPDQDRVFEKANEIIKKEINATVNFVPIAPGEYDQKLQTKYAAGDAGDITWTSSWKNNYAQNVGRGSFIPIDELLEEYAPEVKEMFTEDQWEAVKINEEIYGIPSAQIFSYTDMITLRQDLVDKYELDVNTVKKIEDIEPWLDKVIQGEDAVFEWNAKGRFTNMRHVYGFDDFNAIAAIKVDDEQLKVMNMYETKEFEEYLELVKRWADKGYIASDAMVKKDQEAEKKANKIIGNLRGNYKPGVNSFESQNWGQEMIAIPISDTYLKTAGITATINSITSTSKNPERALMLLQLVNTNAELYNLLSFGIEGEHYEVVADNTIKITAPDKYKAANWVLGNTFTGYLLEGQEADTWEKTIEMNNTAQPSVALGFTFDAAPVNTEISQVQTVIDEYLPGLACGAVDSSERYPEFIEKLKSAGSDKIIEETQRQIDEWAKANK